MQLLAYIGTGYFSRPEGQSFVELSVLAGLFIICSAGIICTCFGRPTRAVVLTVPPVMPENVGGPWGSVLGKCRRELGIMHSYVQETLGEPRALEAPALAPALASITPASDVDRRRWVRHPSNMPALCWVPECRDDGVWIGRVSNISEGGLRLLSSRHVDLGTVLCIRPKNPSLPSDRILEAEVRVVSESGPNEWALGCEFLNELTEDERRAYL